MPAYVIFDVEIRDPARYQEFMAGVKPALKAGACYPARGGAHKVYEGDCGVTMLSFVGHAAEIRVNLVRGSTS
jgi:uncharacterized protein (DUF1330 family)